MKKIVLLFVSVAIAVTAFSQTTNLKKLPSLGIGFNLKDFKTAGLINTKSLSDVLVNKSYAKVKEMAPGLNISYYQGLTNNIDFVATLGATFTEYNYRGKTFGSTSNFLLDLDAHLNFKLLTDNYFVVPYITAGLGTSMYRGSYFMAYSIGGTGLQFNLGEGSFLFLQSTYKYHVSENSKENLNYSLTFASPLMERKAAPVVVAPPAAPIVVAEKDTDDDGIVDSKDKCPAVAGTAKYDGCPVPDTDKDGINDENDKCPKVAGLAKYNGCPIPDTDKDGINDEEDKCKNIPGVASYQGCPIPDTDGDGVNDEVDKCKTVAGPASNGGCPEIEAKIAELAKNVNFATGGSAKITFKNYKTLDEVVAILKEHTNAVLSIEGHTDNVGSVAINTKISQKRADAIKAYFVKKGIDASRLTATGFGSSKPIGDNKTAKGRAENRRVALNSKYESK
ncbi:MAG: OmpA family protein [Flavobacterium sp.]|nr:OmpA family protein [Flavobacterium sp.]